LTKGPCAPAAPGHRVAGADGSLTGFAGGLEKKGRLLRGEGVRVNKGKAELADRFTF
jgi:methylated-DNA-[protein]-cysteine S-methyltransferase